MDALMAELGWANDQGYVVEIQVGEGQFEEIDPDVLYGFAAMPFYGSPLPTEFVPPPPPALPADLAGAGAVINHGLDPADLFAALPFYDAPLPADFLVTELAIHHGQAGDNDHNIGDDAQHGFLGHGVQLVFPPANDDKDDPWKEEAAGKLARFDP